MISRRGAAQRPRHLGLAAGWPGNQPLRGQATLPYRERHAHLPRPRQHPAGVLLAAPAPW